MMKLIFRFGIIALAVYLIATYIEGINATDTKTILITAALWSVIVLLIRPVLKILTFPLTLITFGLFSFVLNALLFFGMAYIVPGFSVEGVIPAVVGSAILSLVSSFADHIFG